MFDKLPMYSGRLAALTMGKSERITPQDVAQMLESYEAQKQYVSLLIHVHEGVVVTVEETRKSRSRNQLKNSCLFAQQ